MSPSFRHEGFADVPGGRIWYGISGTESSKTPVIMIHGGPGVPHDYMLPMADSLNDRTVVFYDQLGCGRSACPDSESLWTSDRFSDELSALIRHLGFAQVILFGQSWGTFLAVRYALDKKDCGIKGLILSSPCLSAPRWAEDVRRLVRMLPPEDQSVVERCEAEMEFDNPEYRRISDSFMAKHVCRLAEPPECFRKSLEALNGNLYRYMWGASEFSVTGTLKNEDLTGRLDKLKMPVLYISGQYDEATPETTAFYAGLTPDAKIKIIENASHLQHLEQPEAFNSAVRDFLDSSCE